MHVYSNICIILQIHIYTGGLWHTWFDQDLGISGRVFVRNDDGTKIEQKLVKIDRSFVHIPNLAIHLQTAKEREAFKINKEDHLVPILSTVVEKVLTVGDDVGGIVDEKGVTKVTKDGWREYQEPLLLKVIATELGVDVDNIMNFELNLFDVQQASLGGVHSEYLHSARLDNLASCFLAVQGLIDYSSNDGALTSDEDISLVALFDHEEIGSNSA